MTSPLAGLCREADVRCEFGKMSSDRAGGSQGKGGRAHSDNRIASIRQHVPRALQQACVCPGMPRPPATHRGSAHSQEPYLIQGHDHVVGRELGEAVVEVGHVEGRGGGVDVEAAAPVLAHEVPQDVVVDHL